jgi:molecular chaperone HscB
MISTFGTDDLNKILRQNCFEIFDLPYTYKIDKNTLNSKYQKLQKLLHPDKFVNHPDSLLSIRVSAHINDAYNTLNSPHSKAIALLEQNGIILDLNVDKELPANVLMEQMELYEEIEDANHDIDRLNELAKKLSDKISKLSDKIELDFEGKGIDCHARPSLARNDGGDSYLVIIEDIKKLAFYNKIAQQIDEKIEESW